jgi:tripartite-type tricarboxylate transporter receptor subunit TctC
VPTIAESGLPGYEATVWMALALPANTPASIVTRLSRATGTALASDEVKKALALQGMRPEPGTSDQLGARMRSDLDKWRQVISAAGIKME